MILHLGRTGAGPVLTLNLASAMAAASPTTVHVCYSAQAQTVRDFEALPLPGLALPTFAKGREAPMAVPRVTVAVPRLLAYLKTHSIRHVIVPMENWLQALILPAVRRAGVHVTLGLHDPTYHSGEGSALEAWTRRIQLANADTILTFSQHAYELVGHGPLSTKQRILIPHPAFPASRSFQAGPRNVPTTGRIRIGLIGRLTPYKGLPMLAEAGRLLRARGLDVETVAFGAGKPAFVKDLQSQYPELVLENRYLEESRIAEILDSFNLLVLPYTEASQSGVLGHAWTAGLPAVVTPVGALPEQVNLTRSGLVATEVDATAVAAAAENLLTNPDLYHTCSVQALSAAKSSRTWEAAATKLIHHVTSIEG